MKKYFSLPSAVAGFVVAAVLVGCFANAQSDRPVRPPRDGQPPAGPEPHDGRKEITND